MAEQLELAQQIQKDNLKPEVIGYADKLVRLLEAEAGNAGFDDLDSYIETLDLEGTRRIHKIVSKLEFIRQKGEIPVDFDKKEFDEKYEALLDRFNEMGINSFRGILQIEDFIDRETSDLPRIPYQAFVDNPRLLESLVKQRLVGSMTKSYIGMFAGQVFNKSLDGLTEEQKSKITQEIDLNNWGEDLYYLGYKLDGGVLRFKGKAANFLGCDMISGKIEAEEAGSLLGQGMKGGIIEAKKAGDFVGSTSKGGKIYLEQLGGIDNSNKAEIYVMGIRQN